MYELLYHNSQIQLALQHIQLNINDRLVLVVVVVTGLQIPVLLDDELVEMGDSYGLQLQH